MIRKHCVIHLTGCKGYVRSRVGHNKCRFCFRAEGGRSRPILSRVSKPPVRRVKKSTAPPPKREKRA